MDTLLRRTSIRLPGTLRFVASEDEYSTYLDRDGEEVYLAHGTAKVLVEFASLDVYALWHEFQNRNNGDSFLDTLRESVIDPEWVDEWHFCEDCDSPHHEDYLYSTGSGRRVCEECSGEYYHCNDCEESWSSTTTTLNDTEVCETCRNRNWSWCNDCDGYYRDANVDDHHHDDDDDDDDDDCGCGCESPDQTFTIRNDGDVPLDNDTRVTITLPAGVISQEGLNTIARHLQTCAYDLDYGDPDQERLRELSYRLNELGDQWQTKDGNYTKRLSRFAYKTWGYKVTPEIMSRVGCIARDHSTAVDFQIETTRDLNQSAAAFAHEDSCWWQSYSEGRCALKTNGGFGLRTFPDNPDYDYATGRAWVMPLLRTLEGDLTPTFDTETPDAFVVFNGYGALSGYVAARIMSHMAGMTYRKISFSCKPMYVNADSGYLIAPEEIAEGYTDGSLAMRVSQHSNLFTTEKKVLTNA